jgi:O-antigen ligase/Tfp pilus assembly protein PilF
MLRPEPFLSKLKHKKSDLISVNHTFEEKAIEISIFLLIILVPLVFYRHCADMFFPIKELIFELLVVIGLVFWGFKIINTKKYTFTCSPLDIPVLCFISIGLLSLFWSNSFFVSLKELPLFLAGPALYFIITNQFQKKSQIKLNRIIFALIIIGSLWGIYGLFQYRGIDIFFQTSKAARTYKVMGISGNVNYFAEYLMAILPLAVSLFFITSSRIKKVLFLTGILLMGLSLMVTFTRSAYLGLSVSLIFMFFIFLKTKGKKFIKENRKIFIFILIAIILTTFLFIIPNPLSKEGTFISKIKARISLTRLKEAYSVRRRIATWNFTLMMIKDRPLLGSGIGTFQYNSLYYQAKFFEQGDNRSIYPHGFAERAHNEYLQLVAELGIIGLGILLWIMIVYFYKGLIFLNKTEDNEKKGILIGLMGAVVAVLVDGIFSFPLHLPATLVLFWLLLGISMNIITEKKIGQTENSIKEERNYLVNIYRYKSVFRIIIILLFIFISVILARPFIAKIYLYHGNIEIRKKNEDEALHLYQKALKYDPYYGHAANSVGRILKNKKLYDTAQEYLERAEKTFDAHTLPSELAMVYYYQDIFNEAVEKFKKAISYQSNKKSMVPIYTNLGNNYFKMGEDNLAKDAYKDALEIEPDFVQAHFNLGLVYFRQDFQHEAIEELLTVIRLAPDSKEAETARMIIHKGIQEEREKKKKEEKNEDQEK